MTFSYHSSSGRQHPEISSLILTAMGSAFFFYGLSILLRARILENTPTSNIRSVALGYAELSGVATAPSAIVSPVSQTNVAWWRCEVEKEEGGSENKSWSTVFESESKTPFFLQDQTGRILVDPSGANLECATATLQTGFSNARFNEALTRLGAAHLISNSFFSRKLRVTESCIPLNGPLYAIGQVRRADQFKEAIGSPNLKREFNAHLASLKRDPNALAQADDNRDGAISPEEWEKFVAIKKQEFEAKTLAVSEKERTELLVVAVSDEVNQPYILATTAEKKLLFKMRLRALGVLALGAAITYFAAQTAMSQTTIGIPLIVVGSLAGFVASYGVNRAVSKKSGSRRT